MWLDCQANMQSSLAKIRHGIRYLVLERVSPFWVWEWFQVACEPTWRHLTHDISWLRKDIEMFQDQVRFLGVQGWSSNLKIQQDLSLYIHAGALDQRPKGNSSFVCPKLWGFLPTSSGTCSCISIQKHNLFLFLFHRIAITGQLRELPDDTFSRSMHTLVSKKKAQLNKGDLDSRHWWIRNNVACDWQVAIFLCVSFFPVLLWDLGLVTSFPFPRGTFDCPTHGLCQVLCLIGFTIASCSWYIFHIETGGSAICSAELFFWRQVCLQRPESRSSTCMRF